MARYYVWDPKQKLFVGCIQHSRKQAEHIVHDFGEGCYLLTQTEARGPFNDDENDTFWMNHTQFGVKYRCKTCAREQLGRGSHNHWERCPAYVHPNKPAPMVPTPKPIQAQVSLNEQLRRLQQLANKNGLYDAADWIGTHLSQQEGT